MSLTTKMGIFIIVLFASIVSVMDSAEAYLISMEFGFTTLYSKGYDVLAGDTGTGYYIYNSEASDNVIDQNWVGHYWGETLHFYLNDYHFFTNAYELQIKNDFDTSTGIKDMYGFRSHAMEGGVQHVEFSMYGPTDIWTDDSLPLIAPDARHFNLYNGGYLYTEHHYTSDHVIHFSVDYIRPVPEPATLLLLGLGLVGLLFKKKRTT